MESRIQRLESEQAEYGRRFEEQQRLVRERVAAVDKKIVEVQQKIDELNLAARRSGADLGVSLSRLQDEFAKLRGELEVAQHERAELQRLFEEYRSRTDRRFGGLEGRGALDEVIAKERIDTLGRPGDRPGLLGLAQKAEADGEPGVARALYDEYVRRWPTDPAAPDAAFRAAELLAGQRRWREALLSYGWIYEKAPRSERVPDAMLGMGLAMLELEELRKDAPAVLDELVQKHPKSPAATRARELLKKLAPPPPPKPAAKPAPKPAPKQQAR